MTHSARFHVSGAGGARCSNGSLYVPTMYTKPRKLQNSCKPDWDSTVSDVAVHKASPEEQQRRRELCKSRNADRVKEDKVKSMIAQAKCMKALTADDSHTVVLREILSDNIQINHSVAKSEELIASVKDLFLVHPNKFRGLPNVTHVQNHLASDRSLPNGTDLEMSSCLDLLSERLMHRTALNDISLATDLTKSEVNQITSGDLTVNTPVTNVVINDTDKVRRTKDFPDLTILAPTCDNLNKGEAMCIADRMIREQLTKDVNQLKRLVDALTLDIIVIQDEFGHLQNEFMKYKRETEQQMLLFKGINDAGFCALAVPFKAT